MPSDTLPLAAELAEVLRPAEDPEPVDVAAELDLPTDEEMASDLFTKSPLGPPPRARWRVDTDERADYACRRADLAEENIARLRAFAAQQKAQIDAWLAEAVKPHEQDRAFFVGSATHYAHRLREADPKFRSLPLPCGWKLTAHDGRAGVDVVDSDQFCTWALANEHDEVVDVKMKPVLREVAKRYAVTPDGARFMDPATAEPVPGLAPRPKGWTAKANPPKRAGDEDPDADDV